MQRPYYQTSSYKTSILVTITKHPVRKQPFHILKNLLIISTFWRPITGHLVTGRLVIRTFGNKDVR